MGPNDEEISFFYESHQTDYIQTSLRKVLRKVLRKILSALSHTSGSDPQLLPALSSGYSLQCSALPVSVVWIAKLQLNTLYRLCSVACVSGVVSSAVETRDCH